MLLYLLLESFHFKVFQVVRIDSTEHALCVSQLSIVNFVEDIFGVPSDGALASNHEALLIRWQLRIVLVQKLRFGRVGHRIALFVVSRHALLRVEKVKVRFRLHFWPPRGMEPLTLAVTPSVVKLVGFERGGARFLVLTKLDNLINDWVMLLFAHVPLCVGFSDQLMDRSFIHTLHALLFKNRQDVLLQLPDFSPLHFRAIEGHPLADRCAKAQFLNWDEACGGRGRGKGVSFAPVRLRHLRVRPPLGSLDVLEVLA
mmetsp:Transcript_1564/g.2160  ORF Transcript_1564/g.2160 Transcript_1564/m.2160 type:complete len:257 (+) Transcript_1564:126-896(+)